MGDSAGIIFLSASIMFLGACGLTAAIILTRSRGATRELVNAVNNLSDRMEMAVDVRKGVTWLMTEVQAIENQLGMYGGQPSVQHAPADLHSPHPMYPHFTWSEVNAAVAADLDPADPAHRMQIASAVARYEQVVQRVTGEIPIPRSPYAADTTGVLPRIGDDTTPLSDRPQPGSYRDSRLRPEPPHYLPPMQANIL